MSSSSRASTPDPQDVETYRQLMFSLFPPSSLPRPPPPLLPYIQESSRHAIRDDEDDGMIMEGGVKRAMTKAEKQNAKKRRRKERERAMRMELEAAAAVLEAKITKDTDQEEHVVEFRLFSSCPVKPVSILGPDENWPVPPNPRHHPMDLDRAGRIRRIAQMAAVDYPQLGGPSIIHPKWTKTALAPRQLRAETTSRPTAPEMFVGVIPRDDSDRPHSRSAPVPVPVPSSNSTKSIPTISLTTRSPPRTHGSTKLTPTRRGRRRRRVHPPSPVARFWAPPAGLGGKARGYAWGYRDSMEGRRDDGAWDGYVRSKDR
ncbi:hypothetical protein IAR55_000026 [Kwoniella newhampshirensis]|uniref:BZIP domain-containing protein n=1 Tax=Kwoniella newhampshirensis TaxID=1651941 RepID=A0AAW0Z5H9_9TREE